MRLPVLWAPLRLWLASRWRTTMVGPSDFRLTRRNLMKAGALGLGMAAIPGLSACTADTPGKTGSGGSVPTVELGAEVTSGGPTFPEGYIGPRITERKPFRSEE